MKITPSGIPVGGVGGSGVFVNTQRIKDGGTATTDGSRVFYQSADGKVRSCALDGSDDHLVLDMGASLIVAGGGHWAVWLANVGLVTSWGLTLSDAAPMAMTDTGDLLVLISYSTGKGLALYRAGSSTAAWARPDVDPIIRYPYPQAFALDADRVVWANPAGQLFTRGLAAPAQCTTAVFDPFLLDAPDGVWVGYHTDDGRCVVHPLADASKGYIVATGDTYGTTATGNFVGYSRTPSESEMVVVPIDWSAELVSLAVPVPTAIAPNVAAKLVVGAWGTLPDTPGNLSIGPDSTKAVICTAGEVGQIDPSRLLALFTSDSDIAQNRQAAEDLKVPLAVYVDDRDYLARLPAILDAVGETPWIPILQCYIDRRATIIDASVESFAREVLAQVNGLPGPWIAAVRCTTGAGTIAVARVIAAMNALVPIVNLPSCLGPALFKWNRGDGVTGVPALKPAAEAWLTGHPQLQPNQAREWAHSFFKETPPMQIPDPELATIRRYAAARPLPQGDGSEAYLDTLRHGWLKGLAETLKALHDPRWGQKRRSGSTTDRGAGAPISAGSIARQDGSAMDVWDILGGTGTGHPTLNDGEYFRVTDQVFFPVEAVNHLDEQPPNPNRAKWPESVKHGVSGFDTAARVHGGDTSYYDLTAPLPLNVFVYTTIDNPQTHRLGRTFDEGLAQTEALLQKLIADHRQAMFIMICGPHIMNNGPKPTRAEILDMVRQEVALFTRYERAVLALSLGNELYQGFEPAELLDPTLWDEVEALIPLQFPFAIGQAGETVVFGPGSVAMMHPDRGKSSADALQILATAQQRTSITVVAREPARIEAGGSGQSRGDIAFVREELDNAERLQIPYFLHLAAGRGAYVSAMDSLQHEALAMIKARMGTPPPPPFPPDPILDADMTDDAIWYPIFVVQGDALKAAIVRELGVLGKPTHDEMYRHYLYRACREVERWKTMRRALAEQG